MDLSRMTRDDLTELQDRLDTLQEVTDVFARDGVLVTVDITPGSPGLIHLPVIIDGPEPAAPELVERFAPEVTIESIAEGMAPFADLPPPPLPPVLAVAVPDQPQPAAPEIATMAEGLAKTPGKPGGLTPAQRDEIRQLYLDHVEAREIAARMNLKLQAVAGYINLALRRGAQAGVAFATEFRSIGDVAAAVAADVTHTITAGQPAPSGEESAEAPLPDVSAGDEAPADEGAGPILPTVGNPVAPEAPVAGGASTHSEKPGGDQGGLQQLGPAENAPVQAGAGVGIAPSAAPAEARPQKGTVPDDLHGENRRIWEYLDRLGYKGRWDADLDMELVELLAAGGKLPAVALEMDIDADALRARWNALADCIRDDKGRPTIDGQQRLVTVLKARVLRQRRQGAAA